MSFLNVPGPLSALFVLFAILTICLVFTLKVLDFLQHTLDSAEAQSRIENLIVKSVRSRLQQLRNLDPVVLLYCRCFVARILITVALGTIVASAGLILGGVGLGSHVQSRLNPYIDLRWRNLIHVPF